MAVPQKPLPVMAVKELEKPALKPIPIPAIEKSASQIIEPVPAPENK